MPTALFRFQRDLRLSDHPALLQALARFDRVIPVYVQADTEDDTGAAARWWLHHSLAALAVDLERRGSRLIVRRGARCSCLLLELARETGAVAVCWSRDVRYAAADRQLARALTAAGLEVCTGNAGLLVEPEDLGRSYRVFTPYWRACLARGIDQDVRLAPETLPPVPAALPSVALASLGLCPRLSWADGFSAHWRPGEAGAGAALARFIQHALADYAQLRDIPGHPGTSRLSPHLAFGEIGPRQIVRALLQAGLPYPIAGGDGAMDRFAAELGWREFAQHLLHHHPDTPGQPLDHRFAAFPWRHDPAGLTAWQRGETGIPMVDAGMRELWRTGWMHNRVRMLVASFLSKNLLVPWQTGAAWFLDTLLDADLASNTLGWQWTAGCGADAAPYFRVFNPVLQGEKFDPDGAYVRRWLPELAALPERWIHRPWEAPPLELAAAGIRLGRDYPLPVADLKASRARALAAFASLQARRTMS